MALRINREVGERIFLFSSVTGFCLGFIEADSKASLNLKLDSSIVCKREEILNEEELSRIPKELLRPLCNPHSKSKSEGSDCRNDSEPATDSV